MHRVSGGILIILLPLLAATQAIGQSDTSGLKSLYNQLDSLFTEETFPEDLFALADSILAIENAKISALLIRAGYVSQVVSAGRSLGIDQYGFSPAVNFFHSSGISAGLTGYWSSEYSPAYYMTNLNVGYSFSFKDKLTLLAAHDFYFYNDSLPDHAFDKSFQASANIHLKHLDIGGDYGYLYGNETAHRAVAHANLNIKMKLKGFVDGISFMPGVACQWGNADVLYWRQPRTALTDLYWLIRNNDYPLLGRGEYLKLAYLLENGREPAAAFFLRQRDYSNQQIADLFQQYFDGSYNLEDTFGFMNFSISFPVIIRARKFSLLLNYTYNQPQSLPGESYHYESNSFFSSSLTYMISWIKK
jgi:hypothetical protein